MRLDPPRLHTLQSSPPDILSMGAHTGLLFFLSLLWTVRSGFAGEPCRGFKHLENGRTFFRYRGLYATFTCNPGFKIHGHHTSSCVSGQWVREPPVCVASGCPSPGEVQHGSSVVSEDCSFVVFSCDEGYRLYGSSLLYCKGKTWSDARPVCKESDIMRSFKLKPVVLSSSSNKEKSLRSPSNLKDHLKSHYNTASKDAYLQPALLDASFPKSHPSGRLLVKPKMAPQQRKPVKKHWLQKTAAHSELAPEVRKNLEATEKLARSQETVSTASVTTPGSISAVSTMRPPVLTTTGTTFTENKMDGGAPKPVSLSDPTRADVHLENKSKEKDLSSPTESVIKGPPETHTVGYPFEGSRTSQQTEVSDQFLNTRTTVILGTSIPHLNLNVMSVASTSAYLETTMDEQNEYPKNLPVSPYSQDRITGGVNQMAISVQSSTDHPLLLDRLETRDRQEDKQTSLSVGDQPPVLLVAENSTQNTGHEDPKELWEETPVETETSHKGTEGIAQVAVTSAESQASLLHPASGGVMPSVPPAAPGPTPGLLPPSPSQPTASSSTTQPFSSVLTEPDDEGLRVRGPSPAEARWDFQPLVEAQARATHLEPVQRVTEAADVTHASPLRLAHQPPHMQSTTTSSANVLIAQATHADSPERSMEAPSSFGPKHGHEGSHLPRQVPITETPLDSLRRMKTLPTSSDDGQTNVTYSLAFSSAGETPSFTPSPSDKARPSELPIRKRRPVCPYPPLPAHGTFYFRTIEKPGPLQYKHYVQYACYPGYTLANGDVYSYCQQNGTWSGITPACLEVTPCSLNNGGCSQLCSAGPHHAGPHHAGPHHAGPHHAGPHHAGPHHRAQCQCTQGFMLLEDLHTCRDIDECVEERHQCLQACVNTFGSFRCSCRTGFQLNTDGKTCMDTSECVEPGQPACEWKCVNLSGSHRCICPRGFRRHTDGGRCIDIDECNYSNGGCSYFCKNLRGGYKCVCPASHRISPTNRKKCLATTV